MMLFSGMLLSFSCRPSGKAAQRAASPLCCLHDRSKAESAKRRKSSVCPLLTYPRTCPPPTRAHQEEEAALLELLAQLPWDTLRGRRVQHYGYRFNYKTNTYDMSSVEPLPPLCADLVRRAYDRGVLSIARMAAVWCSSSLSCWFCVFLGVRKVLDRDGERALWDGMHRKSCGVGCVGAAPVTSAEANAAYVHS